MAAPNAHLDLSSGRPALALGPRRLLAARSRTLHLEVGHRWLKEDGLHVEIKRGPDPVAILGVTKVPNTPALLSVISAGFALGVIGNIHRAGVDSVIVEARFPVHPRIARLFSTFPRLRGGDVRAVRLEAREEVLPTDSLPADGLSVALSGGKDILFSLDRASSDGSLDRFTPGVFVSGVSPEWRHELRRARRLAKEFALAVKVHDFRLWPYSTLGVLRCQLRGMWREFVTIPLARIYGRHVLTGLNEDVMFNAPRKFPNSRLYFSELAPTLKAIEEALNCRISTVPGELEVYAEIRNHRLFPIASAGSCWDPQNCGDSSLCLKCRLFPIYRRWLDEGTMSPEDAGFWLSEDCIGDPVLDPVAQRVLARAERKPVATARRGGKIRVAGSR